MSSKDFIDEYVAITSRIHDAPEIFIETEAYMILSATLGRYANLVVSYKPWPIKPNLWAIFLGPSRIVRKSTAFDFTIDGIKTVDEYFEYFSDGSPEGIATRMNSLKKDDAIGFMRDELGGFFKSLQKKYMAGTREIFNFAHAGRGYVRLLRNVEVKIPQGLYFIVLGTIPTPLSKYKCFSEEDFTSGFLNRFLLVYAEERERRYPITHNDNEATEQRRQLLENLRNEYQEALLGMQSPSFIVSFSSEANNLLDEFDKRIDETVKLERGSFFSSYIAEQGQNLMKLMVLHRLGRGKLSSSILQVERVDFEHALRYLKEVLKGAEKLIKQDFERKEIEPYTLPTEKVLHYIRGFGKEGINWGRLRQRFPWDKKNLLGTLETLYDQGKIIPYRMKTRGRKGVYFIAKEYAALVMDMRLVKIDFATVKAIVER